MKYFYMCLNSLCSFYLQFFMIKALDLEKDTTIVNLLINCQIVISWIIDVGIYRSELDFAKLLGAVIVTGSSTYLILQKN